MVSAAEAALVGFGSRVRAGVPVEEDLHWAAAVELLPVAAKEVEEEAAARNQAVLGGIRVAAEGPELTEVYPGPEKEPGVEYK